MKRASALSFIKIYHREQQTPSVSTSNHRAQLLCQTRKRTFTFAIAMTAEIYQCTSKTMMSVRISNLYS